MRNAERFLSQGKIRGAINEYQRVVENDPRDYSTLNILGDLYAKNRDTQEAVGCFTQVAEHYNAQGFSHKAIAVYNKISRIEPGSIEVSAKLAELYQSKGSVAEARVHYTTLAEHYQKKGQKIEALAIWKQIAELDPNNTEIYLKIAETCWQEEQFEEAARAFTEAGLRFLKHAKFESALAAFSRAIEIKKDDLRALKGMVKAQIGLGCADEAAAKLEEVLQEQPHHRDVLYLLVDCYLDIDNPPQAETAIIKLVAQEPANYPKFLDLVRLYLKHGDADAAARILSMSAEHLLAGGQSEEFFDWTNEILARNPEQIDALRLLVRFYGWSRDEAALKESLERMAEAARLNDQPQDEHHALSQLVILAPHEAENVRRLQELSRVYGFQQILETPQMSAEVPQFENFSNAETAANGQNGHITEFDFADVQSSFEYESNQPAAPENITEFDFYRGAVNEAAPPVYETNGFASSAPIVENELAHADTLKLQKELDSIEFYIEQGYEDLAAKALNELEAEFGARSEIARLRARLSNAAPTAFDETIVEETEPVIETAFVSEIPDSFENYSSPEPETIVETAYASAPENQPTVEEPIIEADYAVETAYPLTEQTESPANANGFEILDELKNQFDADEQAKTDTDDQYETHYHLATAYKEMGLMENAIREFQDAINLVKVNDQERRFFQCANLLGHCFMEKQMPKAAAKWYMRGLEVEDLSDEEKHAIYYELGNAYEAIGDHEKSASYFENLYSENIDYRDVAERLEQIQR